jgi:hypothetical protein
VGSYYVIRKEGAGIPTQLIPFTTGLFQFLLMSPYMAYRFIDEDEVSRLNEEWRQYLWLGGGCLIGWLAFQLMIAGVIISKSALA